MTVIAEVLPIYGGANTISQESLAALHSPLSSSFIHNDVRAQALIPYDRSRLSYGAKSEVVIWPRF